MVEGEVCFGAFSESRTAFQVLLKREIEGMRSDYSSFIRTTVSNWRRRHPGPDQREPGPPLAKLPPEQQREAWAEAVATAPNGTPTAKHVAEVVVVRDYLTDARWRSK